MKLLTWGMDLTLAATLLGLAWAVLFSREEFRAVVLFIALGLVMALVWVRLDALEVGLAEAAIGAGISGALLLSFLGRLHRKRSAAPHLAAIGPTCVPGVRGAGPLAATCGTAERLRSSARFARVAVFFCGLGALVLLGIGCWLLWAYPPLRLGPAVVTVEAMPLSGVSNQVTAVLLNFRSFDTLLELVVLLLAVIGIWSLGKAPRPPVGIAVNPILLTMIRGILPFSILVAGYLVWLGEHAPGGAFQGGAVLGAAGILLALAGRPLPEFCPRPLLRATLVGGTLIFLGLAALPLALGKLFFQYPAAQAGAFILAIEAAAAISIGLALCLLPDAGAPAAARQQVFAPDEPLPSPQRHLPAEEEQR
ncbi:hydrogenase subunit MbhD domain-containing protein [Desulfurivibrio alkaliphilus]|uniref:Na+/H+ antiporter MnhB subunit-related protein n=1 Tax=Desulfurivibrio alkaliphilus (strain DSM 19089 / UNIQEM U267 / AHT2) TaxID=589865 RepID=D6Z737_DESAT|nr:hydrogenase subunit MbhD domain-containing protein [Desulfurivibrio alkaliphilus]ADH87024.1 Na+/H+ antiporter MnhB subunit-related protein [Desulfurivibrio alkaliphilus AHT 2]